MMLLLVLFTLSVSCGGLASRRQHGAHPAWQDTDSTIRMRAMRREMQLNNIYSRVMTSVDHPLNPGHETNNDSRATNLVDGTDELDWSEDTHPQPVSAHSFHQSCEEETVNSQRLRQHLGDNSLSMVFDNFFMYVRRHPITGAFLRIYKRPLDTQNGDFDGLETSTLKISLVLLSSGGPNEISGAAHSAITLDRLRVAANYTGWLTMSVMRAPVFQHRRRHSSATYAASAQNTRLNLALLVKSERNTQLPAAAYIEPMNCTNLDSSLSPVSQMVINVARQNGFTVTMEHLFPVLDLESVLQPPPIFNHRQYGARQEGSPTSTRFE